MAEREATAYEPKELRVFCSVFGVPLDIRNLTVADKQLLISDVETMDSLFNRIV